MNRRGFTLIELMVVIAIIIILAAIAIPNYLNMTARAKKSRVSSDFAALATALESFRTDWGVYPTIHAVTALSTGTIPFDELTGNTATGTAAVTNIASKTTSAGDAGGIVYMTSNILTSMKNPYNSALPYEYASSTAGDHWAIWASEVATGTTQGPKYWTRTDTDPSISEITTDPVLP